MSTNKLENLTWYVDTRAQQNGEPGIYHSYMASLATTLNYITDDFDPIWLMGSSAFAFRIFVNEVMCPSAMSIFHWAVILPEAIEQMGYHCIHISRLWHEEELESSRRAEAQSEIMNAINNGIPAIVWDIADVEWGLIIGYDDNNQFYHTLSHVGTSGTLPYIKLGKNGIDILSVAIPGVRNKRNKEEVIHKSLTAAIDHAAQKEWMDRPKYQDGLPAFDLWALLFDRWVMIEEAGRSKNLPEDIPNFASYYAGHHYSARCYARDYLRTIANGNKNLQQAAQAYATVAACLKPIWECFPEQKNPSAKLLSDFARNIRNAKKAEEEGIGFIKKYLNEKNE